MYCVKCRKSTETSQTERTVTKNNRHMLRGKCRVCGSTKTQFIKKSAEGAGVRQTEETPTKGRACDRQAKESPTKGRACGTPRRSLSGLAHSPRSKSRACGTPKQKKKEFKQNDTTSCSSDLKGIFNPNLFKKKP